jgi:hypothetical protein
MKISAPGPGARRWPSRRPRATTCCCGRVTPTTGRGDAARSAATGATCPRCRCQRPALQRPAGRARPWRCRPAGHGHADVRPARPAAALPAGQPAVWLCKGFEAGTGLLGHEIAQRGPAALCGAVGPELRARGGARPAHGAGGRQRRRRAGGRPGRRGLHGDSLRIYTASDIVGVEVGGAVKNVMAIATGMLDGLAARAAHPVRRG